MVMITYNGFGLIADVSHRDGYCYRFQYDKAGHGCTSTRKEQRTGARYNKIPWDEIPTEVRDRLWSWLDDLEIASGAARDDS